MIKIFSIMANTLDGTEQIIIQPGSDSDTSIRLSRKGACKLGNKSYRGDHIVHLQVNLDSRIYILDPLSLSTRVIDIIFYNFR